MRIHRLTAFLVPIALRKKVRHASHVRDSNETLIVRCVLNDGNVGWGEGLPRTYVTGESTASVWRHLRATDFNVLKEGSYQNAAELAGAVDQFPLADVQPDAGIIPRECFGNAVRCAVELAILDAACRTDGCTIGDMLRQHPAAAGFASPADEVCYSGVLTSMSTKKQLITALLMRLFGIREYKVKVGTQGVDDITMLRRIRRVIGKRAGLRLDANEAWTCDEAVQRILALKFCNPFSVEQPVPHQEAPGLKQVRHDTGVRVMLDESLCCLEDAERAIAGDWCDLFNIRLSKCGGLIRSLKIMALARQHGIGCQLGCQVGETGILSAAGRQFACSLPELMFVEGSFDRFLVADRLTNEDLTFRYGGRGQRLDSVGSGVTVDECRVRRLAKISEDLISP